MSVLIWIQTVLHTDSAPKRIFFEKIILKVNRQQQKHEKLPSMQSVRDMEAQKGLDLGVHFYIHILAISPLQVSR